jgi:hypothetical protein
MSREAAFVLFFSVRYRSRKFRRIGIGSAGSPQRHEGTKIRFVPSCLCGELFAFAASGERFQAMPGIGHAPFAKNPMLFTDYLLPSLCDLGD